MSPRLIRRILCEFLRSRFLGICLYSEALGLKNGRVLNRSSGLDHNEFLDWPFSVDETVSVVMGTPVSLVSSVASFTSSRTSRQRGVAVVIKWRAFRFLDGTAAGGGGLRATHEKTRTHTAEAQPGT